MQNINKIFLLLFSSLFLINSIIAQSNSINYWTAEEEASIELEKSAVRHTFPDHYSTFSLDIETLRESLRTAPMEFTEEAKTNAVLVSIPMPNDEMATFEVWESPVMHPNLAAKFPMMKTYNGRGVSNPATSVRLSITPRGFYGLVFQNGSSVYISPLATNQDKFYQSYYAKDLLNSKDLPKFTCGVSDEHMLNYYETIDLEHTNDPNIVDAEELVTDRVIPPVADYRGTVGDPVTMRTYRFAVACTGEFTQANGGTKEGALATIVEMVNLLNGVFERDLAIRLELIESQIDVIYINGSTDPYTNGSTDALLSENQPNMDMVLGPGTYDFGHVLGTGGWGGLASLATPCTVSRAQAASIFPGAVTDAFTISVVAHEMGHQMGANHSMSSCHNVNSGTAYEPGAGTTIMSYSGICANPNNLQNGADSYYFTHSIQEIFNYMRTANGNGCPEKINTGNTEPDVEIPIADNFYIPKSTAFEMTAIASDIDGDAITYCWEQLDLGPMALPGEPIGNCPLFRSYPPNDNPTRVFPSMNLLLNNTTSIFEFLPDYGRKMTFRCTVRDNNPVGGGTVWDDVKFETTDVAGPFLVESPNTNVTWEVGEYREIKWDVANTSGSLVNCQNVDIYLSVDGGQNFEPFVMNVPNDGSEFALIPETVTETARIKIKAADNIFFDISNSNFEIAPPSAPNYSLGAAPNSAQVCLPEIVTIDISTNSLLGYDDPIEMNVISGLPLDANFSFTANPIQPEESSQLLLDFSDVTEEGTYEVILEAIAPNADTSYRSIILTTVSNDFSTLETITPADGTSGSSGLPEFTWVETPNANDYTIQIATSPTFDTASIVDEAIGVTTQPFTPSLILEENTLYFWRVYPNNECQSGAPTQVKAFHTESLSCSAIERAQDTPIFVSQSGTGSSESKISVLSDGIISDINVPVLKGLHEYLGDVTLTLISPAGTEVNLMKNKCLNYNGVVDVDFDQEAPNAFSCPPVGQMRPQESLAAFLGESTAGLWTLRFSDNNGGGGGEINDWGLEFCTNINLSNPQLLTNEVMPVNPGMGRFLNGDFLFVDDDANPDWQLEYTIVANTANGKLFLNGEELGIGDHFLQSDVTWNKLRYVHDGSETVADNFIFTIEDGEGGWTGTHTFEIVIDASIVVSNDELLEANTLEIFPNPTKDVLHVRMTNSIDTAMEIDILNVHGQLLATQKRNTEGGVMQIDLKDFASGIYMLRAKIGDKFLSKKITVQK